MKHWSNYWTSSNTLNSFAESDAAKGYTGAIKEYWFNVFSNLKANSRIVDIGCGNGALACLAVEYSKQHHLNFEVHAIDAADINPLEALKDNPETLELLQDITFHSSCPVESLPFKAGSVDLFVSQFGFEYADTKKALQQCHLALVDNGTINFLAHHPDSFISTDSNAGAHLFKTILHNSPLFIQIDLLLDIASQVQTSGQYHTWNQNPYNLSISRTVKWILDKLKAEFSEDKYSAWLQDLFSRVIPVLQNVGKSEPRSLRNHLSQQFQILDEHNIRLQEQINATLTSPKLRSLEKYAKSLGLTASSSSFLIEHDPFAWSIEIK